MTRRSNTFRALRRLRTDEAGTSVIELALCFPLLVTFVVGIIDVGMYAGARLTAAQGVFRGVEIVQVNTSAQAVDTIKAEVAAAAGSSVDAADVTVSQELYCDEVKQASYTGSCADGEIVSRYVKISAAAVYTPFLGSMTARFFPRARDDGTIPFTAAAAVRVQ